MPNGSWGPVQRCGRAVFLAALLTACAGDRDPVPTRADNAAAAETPAAPVASGAVTIAALRDVMASNSLVGRQVRVTGRCVTRDHTKARGDGTRVTWQLAADGVAIVVVGPRPRRCASRDDVTVTITALVAEDTLPAIGDFPPAPHRFLVFSGERAR